MSKSLIKNIIKNFFLVSFFFASAIFLSGCSKKNTDSSSKNEIQQEVDRIQVGKEGVLDAKEVSKWYFATSEDNFTKLTNTVLAKDDYGLAQMAMNNEAFDVSNGTNIKIIAIGKTGDIQVRITSGDQTGKSGWIAKELFK